MIPLTDYFDNLHSFLQGVEITDTKGQNLDLREGLSQVISSIHRVKTTHRKVMIIGNGGSAAIASHLQNDFCKAVQVRAMVFTEVPLLTALSNDISYIAAYREQVNLWADREDLLIAISSSGNSPNIIEAINAARMRGCHPLVTMSGFSPDNKLRAAGDINIYVPSKEYGYVELAHSVLTHYISDNAAQSG